MPHAATPDGAILDSPTLSRPGGMPHTGAMGPQSPDRHEDDPAGTTQPAGDTDTPADPRPGWQEVADHYGDTIYTMAYRLTGNADEAADLAQDVFVRVLRNLHTYRPGTFHGWLYRITKNLFLDRVRRARRIRMEPLVDEEEWRHPASFEPGPADVVERGTLEARLADGLESLPPTFRLAIVLCDVEGLSYEEIAEATGWPMGTVRSRIHRARRQLRDHVTAPSDAAADDAGTPADSSAHRGDRDGGV